MTDPDDTLPPAPCDAVRTHVPIPISREDLADLIVDWHLREVAVLCTRWMQRSQRIEDLVGIVCQNWSCRPKVLPRTELARKLAGSDVAAALLRAPARSGHLTLAVTGDGFCAVRHVRVPECPGVADVDGLLVPLTAERQAFVDRRKHDGIGHEARKFLWHSQFDQVVLVFRPPSLGSLHGYHRQSVLEDHWGPVPTRAVLDATWLDVWPGRVLFLLAPEPGKPGAEGWSAEWVDPRRLGFTEDEVRENDAICFAGDARFAVRD